MLKSYLRASVLALLGLAAAPRFAQAQTGSVGIGTTAPNASAALDIVSSSQGLLLPRLTLVQRDALTASLTAPPVAGLVIYQSDNTPGLYAYDGAAWVRLGADNLGNHLAAQNLNLNGYDLVGGTTNRAIRGGLSLDGNGLLTLGAPRVSIDSTTRYGARLLDMDQDVVITSRNLKGNETPAVTGAGARLMWLSYYNAFRAGGVTGDRWNRTAAGSASFAIGSYSAAFGLDNQAGSLYTTAFGWNNRLRNSEGSLATGNRNEGVQAFYGVLMGGGNAMSGWFGLVGGYNSKVRGSTIANNPSGVYVPTWPPSLAFGQGCYARSSRGNTYTLGYYARTRGYYGSFVLADMSPLAIDPSTTPPADRAQDSVYSTNYNQMTMRFAGGYRLFTTVATRDDPAGLAPLGTPVGVQLFPGSNAWQTLSDSTKKERRVLADGNLFLARIDRMRLGSWNYRGQSPDTMRHYGPMAQDFYAAFGHDGVGRSGNATSINQADFDGVNLIAIQALYRRVQALEALSARQQQQLQQMPVPAPAALALPGPARRPARAARLAALRQQNAALQARAAAAEAQAAQATATLESFEARLRRLEVGGEQARK